jgi:hypothetical protein
MLFLFFNWSLPFSLCFKPVRNHFRSSTEAKDLVKAIKVQSFIKFVVSYNFIHSWNTHSALVVSMFR